MFWSVFQIKYIVRRVKVECYLISIPTYKYYCSNVMYVLNYAVHTYVTYICVSDLGSITLVFVFKCNFLNTNFE